VAVGAGDPHSIFLMSVPLSVSHDLGGDMAIDALHASLEVHVRRNALEDAAIGQYSVPAPPSGGVLRHALIEQGLVPTLVRD